MRSRLKPYKSKLISSKNSSSHIENLAAKLPKSSLESSQLLNKQDYAEGGLKKYAPYFDENSHKKSLTQ